MLNKITQDNIKLFAAGIYNNPGCASIEEFEEDYLRIKCLKVIISKYINNKKVNWRIALNHIICLNNVFPGGVAQILFTELNPSYWNILATFLVYLNLMPIDDLIINGEKIKLEQFVLNGNLLEELRNL